MRNPNPSLAAWLAIGCAFGATGSCLAAAAAPQAFFAPAPDLASKLPADKLYPQGRLFPFGYFGPDAVRDKANGCTLLGPYQKEKNVELARQHGLKCTYNIGLRMDFHKKPLVLSRDEIHRQIAEQVRPAIGHDEIAWWYLTPEELRYWRSNEIEYLEVAAQTIRETDPQRRPVWMYDPNHRDAAGLAKTAVHLDLCGKGMYTNYAGQRESRIWVRWTIQQEIEALRMARPSAAPIAVPEMFQQPPDELLPMIPRWARHDLYLSLVSGAKGVVVFSGWRRPKFPAFDAYYQAYAACARELNGELGLGQVFLFGRPRNDLQVEVLTGPKELVLSGRYGEGPGAPKYSAVSSLDVSYGSSRYLFLVNSANEPVRAAVRGLPAEALEAVALFRPGSPSSRVSTRLEVPLDALEVQAYCLRPLR